MTEPMNGALGRVWPLPEGLAGHAMFGGGTHVDVAAEGCDYGLRYYADIRAGTVQQIPIEGWEPGEDQTEADRPTVQTFVPVSVLGTELRRMRHIQDREAFEAAAAAHEAYGLNVANHPTITYGYQLEWLMQEWVAEMSGQG